MNSTTWTGCSSRVPQRHRPRVEERDLMSNSRKIIATIESTDIRSRRRHRRAYAAFVRAFRLSGAGAEHVRQQD